MKNIIKLFFVILLIPVSSYAGSGSSGYFEIKTIRAGGGFLRVIATSPFPDPSNCNGSSTSNSLLIKEHVPSYKEIVSFVLSAKMSNRPIQFWLSGCESDSGQSYPHGIYSFIN